MANEVRGLLREFPSIEHISFIGMSLGGMYNRFALTELVHDANVTVSPVNFITLASPHAGVRSHLPLAHRLAVWVVAVGGKNSPGVCQHAHVSSHAHATTHSHAAPHSQDHRNSKL